MIIAFGWAFVLSVCFLGVLGVREYQREHRVRFRWQNQFLYELFENRYFHFSPVFFLSIVVIASLGIGWVQQAWQRFTPVPFQWLWILLLLWVIVWSLLAWIKPRMLPWFLLMHIIILVLTWMILAVGIYATYLGPYEALQRFLPWTMTIQWLFQSFLLINPRLRTWYQLERIEEENKKPRVQRPNWFVLAYTTWLSLANGLLFFVSWLIALLIG